MKNLTKEEIVKKEQWFQNWQTTIEERLNEWKNSIPQEYAAMLDFSMESLNPLETYILNKYSNAMEIREFENSIEVDAICTYLGEVRIRNFLHFHFWELSPNISNKWPEYYSFDCAISSNKSPYITIDIFPFIGSTVHFREGKRLYNLFMHHKKLFEESKEESIKSLEIPGRGGESYGHFLLLKNESITLESIEKELSVFYKKANKNLELSYLSDSWFSIKVVEDYYFHFIFNEQDFVLEESKEIAKDNNDKKEFKGVDTITKRIEFYGDKDETGEFLNDFIFLIKNLSKISGIVLFEFKM